MDYDQLATNEFNQNDPFYCLWYLQQQPYGLPSEQHNPLLTQDELFLEFDPCLDFSHPFNDLILNDFLLTSNNILEFDQCRLYDINDPQQPSCFEYFNDYETLGWNANLSIYPALDTEAINDDNHNDDSNLMGERESRSSASDRIKMQRQSKRSKPKSSGLELVEIQKYFHLPITKAAKELRVGVTVLKKRCRELNIARWPHRKIKSLKTLIHNVKELGILRNENEIEMLEEQKREVEKAPGHMLTASTKKLRQACFKANYKKRRLGIHATN